MSPPDKLPLRALIYNRVSSDPSGRRVSVESQDTENRAWCEREGVEVVASITDNDRSASRVATKRRGGYETVRTALAGGTHGRIDYLVLWESSRARRDLADYVVERELCRAYNVLLVYKGRVYDMSQGDDRFSTAVDAAVDEREAERIRERAERGHRNSAAKGRPRGQVPYGYRRDYTVSPFAQVPDPETAPIMQGIIADLIAGESLYGIAADLNRRGVPTPQGRKELAAGIDQGRLWSSATIRVLVASQSMTGVRTHLGVAHPEATWEPIVSVEDWAQAQVVLADPWRARHHRGVTPRHLLSGIAECGVCGAWLRAATNRGRPVYQCAGHGVGDPRGKGHVSRGPREMVEAVVLLRVFQVLEHPGLLAEIGRQESGIADRGRDIRAEIGRLETTLAGFEAAALGGDISPVAFGRFEAKLVPRIDVLRRELLASSRFPTEVMEMAGPGAQARWDAPPIQNDMAFQRRLLRPLVRVVVHRSTRTRGERGFDASTVEVTAR